MEIVQSKKEEIELLAKEMINKDEYISKLVESSDTFQKEIHELRSSNSILTQKLQKFNDQDKVITKIN